MASQILIVIGGKFLHVLIMMHVPRSPLLAMPFFPLAGSSGALKEDSIGNALEQQCIVYKSTRLTLEYLLNF